MPVRTLRAPVMAALALALATPFCGGAAAAQTMTPAGSFAWPNEAVVGLSGLHVSDDGGRFVAISDRGWIPSGRLVRSGGRISGIDLQEVLPILGNDGFPVAARRTGDWADAEGLAVAPDGRYWISFERWAHVSRYDAPGQTGHWIKDHPGFAAYSDNRQLEALEVDPDGTLYTFPERPQREGFPIYRLDGADWVVSGQIPQADGFSITGADFDDRGRLYLLERRLVLGLWWQNQVRRLQVAAPGAAKILWTGGWGAYNNLEGISVWRDGAALRITMVSDDNGNRNEATQFVEFWLDDAP